ncbi:MAG: ParB/RepB/Spo0J family partition protein [Bacteroidales bacterium]
MTAKRQALGRGLNALMSVSMDETISQQIASSKGEIADAEVGVIGAIAAIPMDMIEANPYQPRTQFDPEALSELANSIKTNGIIQPITVRKIGKKYQLISGERRLRASKIAGLTEIPAYIRMVNENEALEMALVENIQRENLNAIDIALSYQALMDTCQYNQDKLSVRVGKDRSTVANYLRLLKLPAEVQLALKDNKITMGHARAIIAVEEDAKQIEYLRMIMNKDLSVREVEQMVRNSNSLSNKSKAGLVNSEQNKIHLEWYNKASKALSMKLDAPISFKMGKTGKGNLLIGFSSEKDLEKILHLLNE